MENELFDTIFDLSMKNPEITDAKAYGFNKTDEGMASKLIMNASDIYDMIDHLNDDKSFHIYNYLSLVTTGWAAPLKNGEVDGAPSEHPERRRVSLVILADVDNKSILGSVLQFEGEEEEKVYDYNTATGTLADAFSSIFED
jgi:hypothetical protein